MGAASKNGLGHKVLDEWWGVMGKQAGEEENKRQG